MASPTMQPREPHNENGNPIPSTHSNMRPESINSARSARSPPSGSEHRLRADEQVRSLEAARAWEDLEAETGFASYAAYFESLKSDYAYQTIPWAEFSRDLKEKPDAHNQCAIIDVFKEEASPPRASLRCEELSAVQTLQSLRTPSNGVKVQIVLWSSNHGFGLWLDPEFVTVFGLGLKLNPRFFVQLARNLATYVLSESAVNEWSLPEHIFADGVTVAIGRNCPLAKPGGPPVLLIAAYGRLAHHIDKNELYFSVRPPLPTQDDGYHGFIIPRVPDSRMYAGLLTTSMNDNPDCTISEESLLFQSLLPLLQLDTLRMRYRCFQARLMFRMQKCRVIEPILAELVELSMLPIRGRAPPLDDTADDRMYRYRVFLRSSIEKLEGLEEPLVRFISLQLVPNLTTSPAYHRFAEERGLVLKEALVLEAEIRDFLQLQNGQLSLLESRKSIEVSNNQLQEGKRVKIFTILAFVYIPLNLATSIFGMNLQQLNGSGKSVIYFVVTALGALIITGGSWWLTEQWSSLRAWRKRDPGSYKGPMTFRSYARPAPNYSILVRAAMLVWLVTHGHWLWMVQSGAGWCTLTNSRRAFRGDDLDRGGLFAGDYLSKFIRPDCNELDFEIAVGRWDEETSSGTSS